MIPGFRNPLSKEWPTPRPDDSRIWKQSSAEPNRRHARRNEIPVQADPTVLGELLRTFIRSEGFYPAGMEDFQGKSLRPAFACLQNTQALRPVRPHHLRGAN